MASADKASRERISHILSGLAEAGALASALVAPGLTQLIGPYMQRSSALEQKRITAYLKTKKLIEVQERADGQVELSLTVSGWRRVQRYKTENLQLRRPTAWDEKWRVVMFDIPEKYKTGRDAMTRKLHQLGLYQWQRSVWVYPYECEDEIRMMAQLYGVDQFIAYMVIERTNADLKLHRHFKSLIYGNP